jgi:hypothetical protein
MSSQNSARRKLHLDDAQKRARNLWKCPDSYARMQRVIETGSRTIDDLDGSHPARLGTRYLS